MSRRSTLLLGLSQAALTLLGGYVLLIALVFGVMGVAGAISEHEYFGAFFTVVMWLVFATLEFALARKTLRTLKRWRQEPGD